MIVATPSRSRFHWTALRARSRGTAAAIAEMVLRTFAVEEPPVDVHGIAQAMIGRPVLQVFNPGWSAAAQSTPNGEAWIWINAADAPVRQRFSVAHELGHLLLHDVGSVFRDGTFSGSAAEMQANAFAAALLMPAYLIEPYVTSSRRVADIASAFGASEQAMKYRLENLYGMKL